MVHVECDTKWEEQESHAFDVFAYELNDMVLRGTKFQTISGVFLSQNRTKKLSVRSQLGKTLKKHWRHSHAAVRYSCTIAQRAAISSELSAALYLCLLMKRYTNGKQQKKLWTNLKFGIAYHRKCTCWVGMQTKEEKKKKIVAWTTTPTVGSNWPGS